MRGGEAGAESASDLQRLVGRKPANAAQQRRKVLAIDIFHRKEKMTFDLADIVNAADVRMRHLTRKPDLITKALNRRGILPRASGRNLSATGWPSARSSARYTSPIPPLPRRATTRYRPASSSPGRNVLPKMCGRKNRSGTRATLRFCGRGRGRIGDGNRLGNRGVARHRGAAGETKAAAFRNAACARWALHYGIRAAVRYCLTRGFSTARES